MKIQLREFGTVVILDLHGKLMGGPDADSFRDTLRSLLDEGKKNVIVNLRGINWINSTGIGILITGYTTLRKHGGDLKLLNVSDRIQSILYVTKLNLIFECYGSEDEALGSFETI